MKVVTRFAPSPTGFMHIGGVRTALFAWLWARKNQGTFILRIEDTDQKREVEGSIEHIQESLSWLGIDWDFGPDKEASFGSCIQSKRLDSYRTAAQRLIDKGLAYPDPYTAEELTAFRQKADVEKRAFLFREHRPEKTGAWNGTTSLRFKVPEVKSYSWHDEVRGDLSAGPEALDDFILIKGDGYPTYNFAHIIDDEAMGITHVLRGDEFISSTPRFLSLYDALGIAYPKFVTLPPILRDDKTKKLGKREGAKDILEYRSEGYLPSAMRNFLALIGWNPGTEQEIFDTEELLRAFELSQIQIHGGVFNEDKLKWFNREYLLKKPYEELADYIIPVLKEAVLARSLPWSEDIGKKLVSVIRERINIAEDIRGSVAAGEYDFFFKEPDLDAKKIPEKKSTVEMAVKHLRFASDLFRQMSADDDRFNTLALIDAYAGTKMHLHEEETGEHDFDKLWEYATEQGRGAVLWPLRYALTGREKSPDPFVVAGIIGKEATLRRIDSALKHLDTV